MTTPPSGTEARWAAALLSRLGLPPTAQRLQALVAVAVEENTRATDNPDDTTMPGPPGTTLYNPVGVRDYPTWDDGLTETVATLDLPAYAQVRGALRANSARRIVTAWARSPWGTWSGDPQAALDTLAEVRANWAAYGAQLVPGPGPLTPPAQPTEEHPMVAIVVDGHEVVWYRNPAGHLMRIAPDPANPSGWSVIDVTATIAEAYPNQPPYLAA